MMLMCSVKLPSDAARRAIFDSIKGQRDSSWS